MARGWRQGSSVSVVNKILVRLPIGLYYGSIPSSSKRLLSSPDRQDRLYNLLNNKG
jgi:hypothetical protein